MKNMILLVLCFMLFLPGIHAQVNGSLQDVEGRTVLHVWGSHYERGYAHGYLLSNRIVAMINDYFYASVCGNSSVAYNYLLNYYDTRFTVESQFVSEATGIMEGVAASGQSLYHIGLQRNLEVYDLLMINAIVDLSPVRSEYFGRDEFELGCASISSWGTATAGDPVLNGNLIHTRFMDWTSHPTLIANPVMIVHHPSETGEQKWISFSYPGLMGALSGISYSKSAAFLNMGNSHGGNNFTGMRHVLFSIREALERYDFNGDGSHNRDDLDAALSTYRFRAGTIIHGMWDDALNIEPTVFECNNYGTQMRTQSQSGDLPQDHIAATNHFRVLIEPVYCYRYTNIVNALNTDPFMTVGRQWPMLSAAAGVPTNLMAIQYIPSQDQVLWATSTTNMPAHLNQALYFNTSALFSFNPSDASDPLVPVAASLSCFPNPLRAGQLLKLSPRSDLTELSVYNLRGQLLWQSEKPSGIREFDPAGILDGSGIYLIRATDKLGRRSSAKLLWLK